MQLNIFYIFGRICCLCCCCYALLPHTGRRQHTITLSKNVSFTIIFARTKQQQLRTLLYYYYNIHTTFSEVCIYRTFHSCICADTNTYDAIVCVCTCSSNIFCGLLLDHRRLFGLQGILKTL